MKSSCYSIVLIGLFGVVGHSQSLAARHATQLVTPTLENLYSFQTVSDGYDPQGGLVRDDKGNLYGTTSQGGKYNYGTVFKLIPPPHGSTEWTHNILYSFSSVSPTDGGFPSGSLVLDAAGSLYGTTYEGGGPGASGTVFKLTPPSAAGGHWTETILYAFPTSGIYNISGLTADAQGNLYGTGYNSAGADYGGVFQLSPPTEPGGTWTETTLYTFRGPSLPIRTGA